MVFEGLVKKGELGGFGLEKMGDIAKPNGKVNLAQEFTPTELRPQKVEIEIDEDGEEVEVVRSQPTQEQPMNFFGEGGQEKTPEFFGSVLPQGKTNVVSGIPKEANFFGKLKRPNADKPLIGNLQEGVSFFDNSFNKKSGKQPLKRGTGFDNFVGDIDINALSRGKPDSAVPKTGIFAKGNERKGILRNPVDLSQQNVQLLPNPEGFEDFNVDESVQAFNEVPSHTHTDSGKKAGRPKGSVGKKKRQARKIQKKKKKKKINELTKSRISLLKERERLKKGGLPRNSFQGDKFKQTGVSPNSQDLNFRSFFT